MIAFGNEKWHILHLSIMDAHAAGVARYNNVAQLVWANTPLPFGKSLANVWSDFHSIPFCRRLCIHERELR